MTKFNALYYNISKLLSYDRIMNFVIGARGIGKSYASKRYIVNRFVKHGEQFIYLRRYKGELKKIDNFFNDIAEEFPDVKFSVKGWKLYINGKLAGWAVPLSAWQSEKSTAYPNVTTIFFDEFIREKDNSGYMPNEVSAFLNFCHTVIRNRENARVICMSNAVTVANPYFVYFQLIPDIGRRFNAYSDIVVEIPDSFDFAEEVRKTRFGRLIDGTDYADMSLDNKFVNDSHAFVGKRTKSAKHEFTIVYNGLEMGVWVDFDEALMYVSVDHNPAIKRKYVLDVADFNEG